MRALTSIRTRLALQVAVLLVVLPDSVRAEQEIPHWAFAAPTRDALPIGIQPVDHFIRLRLKEAGLKPSPRAAKHVLIRRLSFDLRGLPPTPEEVLRFLTDDAPEAWLKLVERFLASPHFGERLGQNWLDLARYADTSGYAADRTRNMWIYRDWVINAFNSNKRFDQFTIEQLAGDLLPHSDLNDKIATGFHRNAMQAKGNNPRKEEFRIKTVVDRLKTTGRTWLGLTLDCAECHDHKHDPISQKEYYQLFAIFNNVPHLGKGYDTHGPLMDFFSPEATRKRITIQEQIDKLRKTLPKPHSPSDESLLGTWHKGDLSADAQAFSVTGDLTITAIINTREPVANIVSKNDWRGKQRSYLFGIGAEGEKSGPKGHLFAWISSQPDPWAGVEIYGSTPINDGKEHLVALVYHAGKSVRLFVDGVEDKAARIAGSVPDSIAVSERPLVIGAGYNNSTKPDAYRFQGVLREVRLYRKALADPGQLGPATVELQALQDELARLSPKPLRIPVMDELPKPRETYIHLRGNFKEKGERVFPAVPSILPPLAAGKTANRLTFAKWLMHPDHPLTSRVAVNYLWQHFFGTGLLSSSADFGSQGARPSHPTLLDWLAVEFVENRWNRKDLVRLIVQSETYRQSSISTPLLRAKDSDNRLLARMSRLRLPAEQIRDNALAVSGLLVPEVGGPPVFPVQPKGLYEETGQSEPGNSNFHWKDSAGEGRYRKSIYTYWKRMLLHPSLAAFDGPPRQVCLAKRSITNTPRQALVTLNDPIFHQCAQAFARRITTDRETVDTRIQFAFELCLSRSPDPEERKQFREFVRTGGEDRWLSLATVLLNLDETLTRE